MSAENWVSRAFKILGWFVLLFTGADRYHNTSISVTDTTLCCSSPRDRVNQFQIDSEEFYIFVFSRQFYAGEVLLLYSDYLHWDHHRREMNRM